MSEPFSQTDDMVNWAGEPPAKGEPNFTHVEAVDVPDNHVVVRRYEYLILWCASWFLAGALAMLILRAVT